MKNTPSKIRYAVVGLGHIAQTAVLPAFRHAKSRVELRALVSGDATKLKTLGRRYGVKSLYGYEEFDQCLMSGEIDAVYIALPNSQHAEFALKALNMGVHVLCEKPLALTERDCERLIAASRRSGALLMTAYRLHFDQANLKAVEIAQKKLGELRLFNSVFSYQIKDPANIRLQREEGMAGPLWDIGVYCINAARYLFREEPVEVNAQSVAGDRRFKEVPEAMAVSMRFPGDRLASFTISFGAADIAAYDVLGAKGRLRLEAAYEYTMERTLHVKIGEKTQTRRFKKSDQFAPELVYFADCITKGKKPETSGEEGLADVRIILAIEKALKSGKSVSLERPTAKIREKKRPTLRQWIQRPPVRRAPDTVHTTSPSG